MRGEAGIKQLNLGSAERDYGVIATVRNQDTGELRTMHEPGSTREAMAAIAGRVDRLGLPWLISVLSTPRSIYRDMQGSRARDAWSHSLTAEERGTAEDPREIERQLLGRVGRGDLLEPRSYGAKEIEQPAAKRHGGDASGHTKRGQSRLPGWQRRIA